MGPWYGSFVLAWLVQLIGRMSQRGATPAAAPPAAPAAATAATALAGEVRRRRAARGVVAPSPPTPRVLGLTTPSEPRPLDEEEELAVDALGQRVLERARQEKLGPASAPTMSLRVLNLVASPGADVAEMARLISADPALSAGVLKVANSAAVRGVREIETVRDAITRLGLEEVGRVAGALAARSLFNPRVKTQLEGGGAAFAALYRRAVVVATAAADLAMRVRARPDRAFLGGMLHDVGRTVALHAWLEGRGAGRAPGPARAPADAPDGRPDPRRAGGRGPPGLGPAPVPHGAGGPPPRPRDPRPTRSSATSTWSGWWRRSTTSPATRRWPGAPGWRWRRAPRRWG